MNHRVVILGALGALAAWVAVACGGKSAEVPANLKPLTAPGGSRDPSKWPADDKSLCDWKNKPDVEVSETSGPGALRPNVRRVFRTFGEAENRHKSLLCREIDTNLDGIKDVVRTFNPKGEALTEKADRDFDGRIDVWINFVDGRMAEEQLDTNGDGKPDLWKFYVNGQLQRVRRDRNFDGKPDLWEIYTNGRLERVGYDETFDGHVDRWERDEQMKYDSEAAERRAREQMDAVKDAGAPSAETDATHDGGAPKGTETKSGVKPATPKTPPAGKK